MKKINMMKQLRQATLLAALFSIAALSAGCKEEPQASAPRLDISVAEVAAIYSQNPDLQILDVRTLQEYEAGHISNSILAPLNELTMGQVPAAYDKSDTIYVLCRSGNRSMAAVKYLRDIGYENAYSISGGITQWHSQGHPVTIDQ